MTALQITQVIGGIGDSYGGPSRSVPALSRALAKCPGAEVDLITTAEPGEPKSIEARDGYQLRSYRFVGPDRFRMTPGFGAACRAVMRPGKSVLHMHGLWMHPQWAASHAALRRSVPLIVSPRGMFQSWAMDSSSHAKKLMMRTVLRRALAEAAAFHALSEQEAQEIRDVGVAAPIIVLPNGIDPHRPASEEQIAGFLTRWPALRGRSVCLFLSRIHRKKNIEGLLAAWQQLRSEINTRHWALVIAGEGEPEYMQKIQYLAAGVSAEDCPVVLTGPVYGEDKQALLSIADVFAMPSYSEGFSMAILEAAAAGLPVLMTPQCNFPELEAAGGGVVCDHDAIAPGLKRLLCAADAERQTMATAARGLIAADYTWSEVGKRMFEAYSAILGRSAIPSWMYPAVRS